MTSADFLSLSDSRNLSVLLVAYRPIPLPQSADIIYIRAKCDLQETAILSCCAKNSDQTGHVSLRLEAGVVRSPYVLCAEAGKGEDPDVNAKSAALTH